MGLAAERVVITPRLQGEEELTATCPEAATYERGSPKVDWDLQ